MQLNRISFLSIAGAVALSVAAAGVASAQGTDTSRTRSDSSRTRADSMRATRYRATSSQRIPVRKDLGTTGSMSDSGRMSGTSYGDVTANRDTTGMMNRRDTTGMMNRSDTTGAMRSDTGMFRSDTSAMGRDSLMRQDSIRRDSIARQDSLRQDSIGRLDSLRQDSIMRQDSLARMRADSIANAMPDTMSSTGTVVETRTVSPGPGIGNGFYWGLAAGASVPTGNFGDFYKTGFNVTLPLGWQPMNTALGFRLDLSYDRLGVRDDLSGIPGSGSSALSSSNNPAIWGGALDATYRLPLSWRSSLYAVGGAGVHYFQNYGASANNAAFTTGGLYVGPNGDGSTSSRTKFGLNGGLGLSFGLGGTSMFLESRFVSVFTQGANTNYVPVVLGVTFR